LLRRAAAARGRTLEPGTTPFAVLRERRLDALGDLVERHIDADAILELLEDGAPPDLPTITSEVRGVAALRDDR
ncbi:MAG: hypothetical protein M3401_02060, partial [Actinomycetota bacterium]|nr:hypothetical protein [Actinomycetota bacterium]